MLSCPQGRFERARVPAVPATSSAAKKWWFGRGDRALLLNTRQKHIWRCLRISGECRLQVKLGIGPQPHPSFYLCILPSYRVTSSELQRILFLDYTQRGMLLPTVKIRWHPGQQGNSSSGTAECDPYRNGDALKSNVCDPLLGDSAARSLERHPSTWQPLRGCSRVITIDFLLRRQQKACTRQIQHLKIYLRCCCRL